VYAESREPKSVAGPRRAPPPHRKFRIPAGNVDSRERLALLELTRDVSQALSSAGGHGVATARTESDEMEARIARLESDVAHIRSDVGDLKSDARTLRDKIDSLRDQLGALRDKIEEKTDSLRATLDARFERVDARFERVDARIDTLAASLASAKVWALALYVALAGSLFGVLARGFGWI
jgi:predicted RNase H-like nuclease (RuvC/YqgF family)